MSARYADESAETQDVAGTSLTSTYSSRASEAGPRRAARLATRRTRTAPCSGMVRTSPTLSFACGLPVGWRLIRIEPCSHQVRAIRARAHDPGTPQPLIQPLPVLVFYVGYRTPPLRSAARAANGPPATFIGDTGAPVTAGRRRRSGISMAGAGGPCWSPTRPAAGSTRNPSWRNTAGSISGLIPKRDAKPDGSAAGPRRAR